MTRFGFGHCALHPSHSSCENRPVTDADTLARIDAHMRRGNELLARLDAKGDAPPPS